MIFLESYKTSCPYQLVTRENDFSYFIKNNSIEGYYASWQKDHGGLYDWFYIPKFNTRQGVINKEDMKLVLLKNLNCDGWNND